MASKGLRPHLNSDLPDSTSSTLSIINVRGSIWTCFQVDYIHCSFYYTLFCLRLLLQFCYIYSLGPESHPSWDFRGLVFFGPHELVIYRGYAFSFQELVGLDKKVKEWQVGKWMLKHPFLPVSIILYIYFKSSERIIWSKVVTILEVHICSNPSYWSCDKVEHFELQIGKKIKLLFVMRDQKSRFTLSCALPFGWWPCPLIT